MKKIIPIFVFFILLFQIVSAVDFELKDSYGQGETIIAKLSGNFLTPVQKENIEFYRGHVKVPMIYDITKIENVYYLYAQLLGKQEANYSIKIKDVRYMAGAQSTQEPIIANFTITNKTADFNVDPAVILTDKSFSIQVQNLQDNEITIELNFESDQSSSWFEALFGEQKQEGEEFELLSGETEKIYFDLNDLNYSSLEFIKIKSENTEYEIPIYIFVEQDDNQSLPFKFLHSDLEISLTTSFNTTRTLRLKNPSDIEVENIEIVVSNQLKDYIKLDTKKIKKLEPNETEEIVIEIFAGEDEETIVGQIKAKSEDYYSYIDLTLNFVEGFVPEQENNKTQVSTSQTCAELEGIICESDETCSGQGDYAKDGYCCFANCEKQEKKSSSSWIGWVIIIVIIIFVIWFIKAKYLKTRREINLLDFKRK